MKILFASSEAAPFAKTGGLADVAGALPKSIKNLGYDIRLILPKYKMLEARKYALKKIYENLEIPLGGEIEKASIYEAVLPGSDVLVYFVENDKYFNREGLYQEAGQDYPDNAERFIFFCKAVIKFLIKSGWQPQILHCNDWQTALLAAYLKILYKDNSFFSRMAVIYSIHNLAYQGVFAAEKFTLLELGWDQFTPQTLEFNGNLALTKAGLVYADIINTVSSTYAQEIQTPQFGCGLENLIAARSKDVYGILNGVDYTVWDPESDPKIAKNFSYRNLGGKKDNKQKLELVNKITRNKNLPLLGIVSRLADQKGFDILAAALENILELGVQLVLLGTGEIKYHQLFTDFKARYPDCLGINLGFDAAAAQLIYAGADMFLMPSRFEPCGLGQLISFKYGTVPIVRKTGGLADTVHDYNPRSGEGDGFVFEEYSAQALVEAVKRAVGIFKNRKLWQRLQRKIMQYDYSWEVSAKKYMMLYKKALEKIGG